MELYETTSINKTWLQSIRIPNEFTGKNQTNTSKAQVDERKFVNYVRV